MANDKPKVEAVEKAPVKPVVAESIYPAAELAKNYQVFKTSRAIVETALKLAGKKTATLTEATEIINKFKNKEVK